MAHICKCVGNSKTMGINLLKRLRHAMAGFRNYLFHRARTVAQGENVAAEEEHLRGVL